jgi:succinate dehydrogenase / fumarate reductase flavoprotein subunit
VHPTCIPGEDKLRLMSESARGEGGRVWVPKTPGDKRDPKSIPEKERWYFLEEWYPKYGNLVPRDVATRAIFKVVYEHNLGIDGKPMVYLDLTHIDARRSTASWKASSKSTRSLSATIRATCP